MSKICNVRINSSFGVVPLSSRNWYLVDEGDSTRIFFSELALMRQSKFSFKCSSKSTLFNDEFLGRRGNRISKILRQRKRIYPFLCQGNLLKRTMGYRCILNFVGIGFKVMVIPKRAVFLKVGYSHLVGLKIPFDLDVKGYKRRYIVVEGDNLSSVVQFCSSVRSIRPPDSYKGNGIRFLGENVRLKAGKLKNM